MYSLEATHHYVYMCSFQPIFYYLIDWHILSISFIDPFQQVFILAIFKKPCRRCKFGDHITNFYFYSLRWNLVTLCLIYVFFFSFDVLLISLKSNACHLEYEQLDILHTLNF